jgi:hypothetical protein
MHNSSALVGYRADNRAIIAHITSSTPSLKPTTHHTTAIMFPPHSLEKRTDITVTVKKFSGELLHSIFFIRTITETEK